jgi:uncharacterized protein
MDAAVVAEIDNRIANVGVKVPWAIESGSRAWGFPSPDSDYDCRFIYVRSMEEYLTPWRQRDVIETPLDKIFDVNGWDLMKAVQLLVKGNAVVTEWLRSPIVYVGDADFRDGLLALAQQVADRALTGRHYLHVGRQRWASGEREMVIKRVFYSVRPAAVLRWMRVNPTLSLPPMNLGELLEQCDPPAKFFIEIQELIARKLVTRELGRGVVSPVIARFVESEFALGTETYENADMRAGDDARKLAEAYFRDAVARFGN